MPSQELSQEFIRFAKEFIQECQHELHMRLFGKRALKEIAELTQPVAVWALLDSLGEFIANSFDAGATNLQILCDEGRAKIDLIDDGKGFPDGFFEAGQTNTNYLDFVKRNQKDKRAEDDGDSLVFQITSAKRKDAGMLGGMGMGLLRLATVLDHIDTRNIVLCANQLDTSGSPQGAITTLNAEQTMLSVDFAYAKEAALCHRFMVTATEAFDSGIYAKVTQEQKERILEWLKHNKDKADDADDADKADDADDADKAEAVRAYLAVRLQGAETPKAPGLGLGLNLGLNLSLDLSFATVGPGGQAPQCVTPFFNEDANVCSSVAATSVSATSLESAEIGAMTSPGWKDMG